MVVRAATEGDFEGIARVLVASWAWGFAGVLPPEFIARRGDVAERAEALRKRWSGRDLFLVAEEEGRILGMANELVGPGLPGFDAEILGLYVHPDVARRGIGRSLVREMARGFRAKGHRSLAIHTLAENRIGRGFYEGLGGRVHRSDDWSGFPAVWYVWDAPGLTRLAD